MFCRIITLLLVLALPAASQVIIKAAQADGLINAAGEATIAYPGPRQGASSRPANFTIHTEAQGSPTLCTYEVEGSSADVDANGNDRSTGQPPVASSWILLAPESGTLSCMPAQDQRDHVVANRPFAAIRVVMVTATAVDNLIVRYSWTD